MCLPLDFWSLPSTSEIQNGPVDPIASTSGSQGQTAVTQDRCTLLTRGRQGKLCFINPLFLQLEVSKVIISASTTSHILKMVVFILLL